MVSLPKGLDIRTALPEDKESVLEFCHHTWDWGDYIPRVWDTWLSDPKGRLAVALIDNEPVAVAQVTILATAEAWLQGFRVAPAYRSQGIATGLGQYCIKFAIQSGAKVVRYSTLVSNASARRIGDKLGFQRVATFVSYRTKANADSSLQLPTACPRHWAEVFSFIKESKTYKSSAGLYCTGWAYHRLTLEKLQKHLNGGEVFMLDEMARFCALAIVTTTSLEEGKVVGYMDGTPDAIRDLALALRAQSAECVCPQIEARLPDTPIIRDALSSAGYVPYPEEPFSVFELSLGR